MKLAIGIVLSALLSAAPAPKADPPLPTQGATFGESVVALDTQDEARKLADAYLKALTRQGGTEALETLLGGATLRARATRISDYKVVGREKHGHEEGRVEHLQAYVLAVDTAARAALAKISGGSGGPTGDLQEVTAEEATRILEPTRQKAKAFQVGHPVFSYIARVDKPVYWHPANPFRKLLADAGEKGDYQADIDLFWIETSRSDGRPRKWPLRVVRFAANGKDSGLKVLPASDWNAE
jgi:hypothetical protein